MSQEFITSYRERFSDFSHELRVAGSLPVYILLARHGARELRAASTDTYLLSTLIGARPDYAWLDAGDGRVICERKLETILWHSPFNDTLFHVEGVHDVLMLALPGGPTRDYLAKAGIADARVLERGAFEEFHDPAVSRAMRTIWNDARRAGISASLLIDANVWTILSRMLGRAQALPPVETAVLDDAALGRVIDFMEAGLAGPVTADALADLAGLPPGAFLRAFEDKIGHAPDAYLTGRRVARASEMLAVGDMPIARIALACGFASMAQFTTVFRRATGVTPAQYRRRLRH